MQKFRFLRPLMVLAVILTVSPNLALASDIEDGVIAQLRAQGYQEFTISTTFLGRLRILAIQGGTQREIVINPRTGEVLRDQLYELGEGAGNVGQVPTLRDDGGRQDRGPDTREDRPEEGEDRSGGQNGGREGGNGGRNGGQR